MNETKSKGTPLGVDVIGKHKTEASIHTAFEVLGIIWYIKVKF